MQDKQPKRHRGLIMFGILLLVILFFGWHLFFPLMITAAAIGAGIWGVLIGIVGLLCVAILLAFVVTGAAGFIILSIIGVVLTVAAIVVAPFAFPLLLPLLVVLLVVNWMRKRDQR